MGGGGGGGWWGWAVSHRASVWPKNKGADPSGPLDPPLNEGR